MIQVASKIAKVLTSLKFVTLSVELADQHPNLAREINEGFIPPKAMINRLLEQGKASGGER